MKRLGINLSAAAVILCGAFLLADAPSLAAATAPATCTTSGGTVVTGDCCETTVGGGCRCGPCG